MSLECPPMKPIKPFLVLLGVVVIISTLIGLYVIYPRRDVRLVRLRCPNCNITTMYGVTPHNPQGVSHTEVLYCSSCYRNFRVVVYYDGEILVVSPK